MGVETGPLKDPILRMGRPKRQVSDFCRMEGPPQPHHVLRDRGLLHEWQPGTLVLPGALDSRHVGCRSPSLDLPKVVLFEFIVVLSLLRILGLEPKRSYTGRFRRVRFRMDMGSYIGSML